MHLSKPFAVDLTAGAATAAAVWAVDFWQTGGQRLHLESTEATLLKVPQKQVTTLLRFNVLTKFWRKI